MLATNIKKLKEKRASDLLQKEVAAEAAEAKRLESLSFLERASEDAALFYCLSQAYAELKKVVYRSCGRRKAMANVTMYDVWLKNREDLAGSILKRRIEQMSGLSADFYRHEGALYWTFQLTSAARACDMKLAEGTARAWDFAALAKENSRRIEQWPHFLPKIAEVPIGKIKAYLEGMPDAFLGIPEVTTLTRDGRSALSGSFEFYGDDACAYTVEYELLEVWQWQELAIEINARLAHGEVEFSEAARRITSIRRVSTKEVADPLFDFEKFYKKYDAATPELVAMFEQIVDGLRFKSVEDQVGMLATDFTMSYQFPAKEGAFKYLVKRMPNEGLMAKLKSMIKEKYEGVFVVRTDFLFDGKSNPKNGYVEIKTYAGGELTQYSLSLGLAAVRLGDGWECSSSKFPLAVVRQAYAMRAVNYVKCCKVQYFAMKIAKAVIANLKSRRTNVDDIGGRFEDEMFKVTLNGKLAGMVVDLAKVQDATFLARIDRQILRITGGFIQSKLAEKYYRLNW